jgi:hypothetical protein
MENVDTGNQKLSAAVAVPNFALFAGLQSPFPIIFMLYDA